MCLIATHFFPKISFKKIKVYKLVRFVDGEYYSAYQNEKLLERAKERFMLPEKMNYAGKYQIEEGMIHACTNLQNAIERQVQFFLRDICSKSLKVKIITAYIPPFTRYYIGEDGDICAKRMKYEISV